MGRPYDHEYHEAGSGCRAGTMICAACGKPIDNKSQSWRCYTRTKNWDWGYVTHHRECCANDPKWAELDREKVERAETYRRLTEDAYALVAKYPGWDVLSTIEDAAARACKPVREPALLDPKS